MKKSVTVVTVVEGMSLLFWREALSDTNTKHTHTHTHTHVHCSHIYTHTRRERHTRAREDFCRRCRGTNMEEEIIKKLVCVVWCVSGGEFVCAQGLKTAGRLTSKTTSRADCNSLARWTVQRGVGWVETPPPPLLPSLKTPVGT